MKILITGCAGMFGSHLAEAFCEDGHQVFGLDNLATGYEDNIISHLNFTFYNVDITDYKTLQEVFPEDVDIVFHAGCIPFESCSVWIPSTVVQSVVMGTTNIATLCIQKNVKRLINFSSTGRYGLNKIPYEENLLPMPRDPYSIAKYSAEKIIDNLANVHGLEWVNLIPHNSCGSRAMYDSPYRNVIMIWANQLLNGKTPYIYGDGETIRCFSFVEDQIDLIKNFAFCDLKENGESFNIGGSENRISLNKLFETIAKLLDFKGIPYHISGHKQEVKVAYCSNEKIRRRFGYKSTISLEDGIKNIINYIKKRGPRPFKYNLDIEIMNDKTPVTWRKNLL